MSISRFLIPAFENPVRLDRYSSGGGIMLYIREEIPFKLLKRSDLSANTEAFLVEVKKTRKNGFFAAVTIFTKR